MQYLITSYLVQRKECSLPLLGKIKIHRKSEEPEIGDKQVHPPVEEILFDAREDYLSDDLITYIAHVQNSTKEEAEENINNWCLQSKMKLDNGQKINFISIGSLQKNQAGHVFFQTQKGIRFFDFVSAERASHPNEVHSVMVGDHETTSAVMSEFYRKDEIVQKKSYQKIWVIVLLGIAILFLLYYFYTHNFSVFGIGNHSTFPVSDPPGTYKIPSIQD
jgi:nucleoid DNA-binding protein